MKAIMTKYHGPTDFRGSRVSAFDGDGNRVYRSINHALSNDDNRIEATKELCRKMNWHGTLMQGDYKGNALYVFVGKRGSIEV